MRIAAVVSLLSLFSRLTAGGFYGSLASQLMLLRADEPTMRLAGLQRLQASSHAQRVEEMHAAGGFRKLVELLRWEKEPAMLHQACLTLKAWAEHEAARRHLLDADAVAVLQTILAAQDEPTKLLIEDLIIGLLSTQ